MFSPTLFSRVLVQSLNKLSPRSISSTGILFGDKEQRMRDKFFKHSPKVEEGLKGEEMWIPGSHQEPEESRFPTLETFDKTFYGIPYKLIPIIHVKSTKNNTIMSVTDHNFLTITDTSTGKEGFKNARKKTTVAAQSTGVAMGQRCLRRGIKTVRVIIKGIGPGRITSIKGLVVAGVNIVSITDLTKLKELGPRPKKARRL